MAFGNGPRIVTNGLTLCLDVSDRNSYPGSGTTWFDVSGNKNHGTISSGEFVSNGSYLQNSGGISNFFVIDVSDSTSLNNTFNIINGGWTIEEIIWTNSTNYPEADAGSVGSSAAYGGGATGFDWNHGYGISGFRFGQSSNSGGSYEDDNNISISSQYSQFNTWRVRTMIWDRGSNLNSLYIDGVFIGSVNTPNTAGTSIYDGGGITFGALYGWKHYGRRASIRIYNKVLSASEILQNYNTTKSRFNLK
jgi:hypothetical protein